MPEELVVLDPRTGYLLSNPEAFSERGFPVAGFSWLSETVIYKGKRVEPRMALAVIFWDDGRGTPEVLYAPARCGGIIVAVNQRINLDDLPRPSMGAQVLLCLR
jgi:hypothetical protein